MRLKDKVAIVTGASSDIGLEISKRFVEEGANVVLIGRNFDKLEKARKTIKNYATKTVGIPCDLTNMAQVLQTVEQVSAHYGKIDILVNNAGLINDPIHFHEMSESDWSALINTNIYGIFRITKSVLIK